MTSWSDGLDAAADGDKRPHVCPALAKVRTSAVAAEVLTFARLVFLCAPRVTASLTRVVPCAQLLMPRQPLASRGSWTPSTAAAGCSPTSRAWARPCRP